MSTPPWSLRPPTCEPELWLVIGKPAQRAMRAEWQADDPDASAAQEDVSSDGGLAAQRTRRRCVACVETLVQQARALIMTGTHGHVFLELCCASDSKLAAAVVEHSVAIRATSSEDLQLASTRCALHRLLRICEAYDVVVDIWVSIPCTVGTRFGWINDTYKLVVVAIGLCRHVVRNGGGFCWEWTNVNEFWDLAIVRNFFAKCDTSSCLVSTAAVGQQFVDSEGRCSVSWPSLNGNSEHVLYIKGTIYGRDLVDQFTRSSTRSRILHPY